jgi:hypothetical protein
MTWTTWFFRIRRGENPPENPADPQKKCGTRPGRTGYRRTSGLNGLNRTTSGLVICGLGPRPHLDRTEPEDLNDLNV